MSDDAARYRALVELAPDGIVEVDSRGRIVLINAETRRMFGYAGGELLGQPVGMLMPERFRQVHLGHQAAYARNPALRAMGSGLELVGRRKDGSEFPVEISLSPTQGGGDAFAMAIIRDISERKRAEAALRESEAQFRTFAQAMPNHVWASPPDGLLNWFNERVYEYSGLAAGTPTVGQSERTAEMPPVSSSSPVCRHPAASRSTRGRADFQAVTGTRTLSHRKGPQASRIGPGTTGTIGTAFRGRKQSRRGGPR